MGIPIPFNSMGQIMVDLVPALASFVDECASASSKVHSKSNACETGEGKSCISRPRRDGLTALMVRCSDLAYLTQLHHITAWQQHRAIATHAAVSGNHSVLRDPLFQKAKSKWLRLYLQLDKEIKALPATAHMPLIQSVAVPATRSPGPEAILPLSPHSSDAELELLAGLSHLAEGSAGIDGSVAPGETLDQNSEESTASLSLALPSLIPYLRASAEFSKEALHASFRQLGTFNLLLISCGIILTLSSLLILVCTILGLSRIQESCPPESLDGSLPAVTAIARCLVKSGAIAGFVWILAWVFSEVLICFHPDLLHEASDLVWHQLPTVCVTGALCTLAFPFAQCVQSHQLNSSNLVRMLGSLRSHKSEPLAMAQNPGWRFAKMLQHDLCFSHLWLNLFGGGTLLCYFSLMVLCIVPLSDCFVDMEFAIVKFLIGLYCISAGLAVFATPSSSVPKIRIASAYAV